MKAKQRTMKIIKIIIDILMTVTLIMGFLPIEVLSSTFHFVAGSCFFAFLTIHVILNRRWLVAVTKGIKKQKVTKKTKWQYAIDIILIIIWTVSIITAIPAAMEEAENMFISIHAFSSTIGLVFVIVHIVQHRKQIVSYFRKKKIKSHESLGQNK